MGGKGGGGGGGIDMAQLRKDPQWLAQMRQSMADEQTTLPAKEFQEKYGPESKDAAWYKSIFPFYGEFFPSEQVPAPAPAAALADVPAPAPAPEAAPAPAPAAAPSLGPPISSGGAIAGPTSAGNAPFGGTGGTGDALGGSVLNPPKYWVGGINSTSSGRGQGKMRTTQT